MSKDAMYGAIINPERAVFSILLAELNSLDFFISSLEDEEEFVMFDEDYDDKKDYGEYDAVVKLHFLYKKNLKKISHTIGVTFTEDLIIDERFANMETVIRSEFSDKEILRKELRVLGKYQYEKLQILRSEVDGIKEEYYASKLGKDECDYFNDDYGEGDDLEF